MKTRVMKLTRVRSHADAGGGTIFFTAPGLRRRRFRMFFRPDDVPDFDGKEAWFLAEQVPKIGWRIVQRVNPDGSPYAEPLPAKPEPNRTPAEASEKLLGLGGPRSITGRRSC